jgi:hypothetical protein
MGIQAAQCHSYRPGMSCEFLIIKMLTINYYSFLEISLTHCYSSQSAKDHQTKSSILRSGRQPIPSEVLRLFFSFTSFIPSCYLSSSSWGGGDMFCSIPEHYYFYPLSLIIIHYVQLKLVTLNTLLDL